MLHYLQFLLWFNHMWAINLLICCLPGASFFYLTGLVGTFSVIFFLLFSWVRLKHQRRVVLENFYMQKWQTRVDPKVAAKKLDIDWDSAGDVEPGDENDEMEVPPAVVNIKKSLFPTAFKRFICRRNGQGWVDPTGVCISFTANIFHLTDWYKLYSLCWLLALILPYVHTTNVVWWTQSFCPFWIFPALCSCSPLLRIARPCTGIRCSLPGDSFATYNWTVSCSDPILQFSPVAVWQFYAPFSIFMWIIL